MNDQSTQSVAQRKSAFRQVQLGAHIARVLMVEDRSTFEALRSERHAEGHAVEHLENQFLWGVFSELVNRSPSLPTSANERVKLHLVRFSTQQRGMSAQKAIAFAKAIEVLHDVADPEFEIAQARGRSAVVGRNDFL